MHNENNYIISLGRFCKWLSDQAESMGVEIYPGFTASKIDEKIYIFYDNSNLEKSFIYEK